MSYELVVVSGPDSGRAFPLEEGQTLIVGRGPASHTRINDPRVSRVHCHLRLEGDRATLTDAGGTSGTVVDNQPVQRHLLQPGSTFQVGESRLRFQAIGSGEATTLIPQTRLPSAATGATATAFDKLVGQSFGNYRLEKVLAEGTSGVVFRGADVAENRPVAVKVLAPEVWRHDEQKERFIRAMQTMLPIRDEHIVALYAAGKNGPYCWAAMEFVDGESLARVIQRIGVAGMLDWRDALRVAMHVGRALETAYRHKIIHRNVTPENILQRKSDKAVKLGDLILAKALEGTQARQITQDGKLVGDLPYLAPERTYDRTSVDHRADQYALGATVYALLTGRTPFKARTPLELIDKIRTEEPEGPRKYQLSIPDLFQDIVLRMLAKSPEDRFQKPADLLKELSTVARYQGITL
jgi:serine/threonine protein kinase